MGFDLGYLLFLQELRNALGGALDEFFNALSKMAVTIMVILPYYLYWCVDKRIGFRFILSFNTAEIVNGVTKLTVCAYRPWIRSDAIIPAGDSKVAATGYSFPSGHTVCATSVYGNTALWQYKRNRWISVVAIILLLLTAFSRNFLGVHTPQDVIVGMLESALILFVVVRLEPKLNGKNALLDKLTFIGIVVGLLTIVYVLFKPYPMDYINGVLIVDPKKMMPDHFRAVGLFVGTLAGSYIDRHYLHYEVPLHDSRLPLLGIVGFILMNVWKELFANATVVLAFGPLWGNLLAGLILAFFGVAVYPMLIQKAIKKPEAPIVNLNVKEAETVK